MTATTLLWAIGSALILERSACGVSLLPVARCTRLATSMLVTNFDAVSTGRVGSLESVISPSVARVGSALETGVMSRLDCASYIFVAVST